MNRVARLFRVVFALCFVAIGTFQGVIASPLASPAGSQSCITISASGLAGVQSATAPAELHEYYGTLTFEDGQQFTGGPAIQPGQMIYMDVLGTQELLKFRVGGLGPQLKWSRDAQGRLMAVELYHHGRKRTASLKGTRSEPIEIENEGDHIRGRLHLPTGNGPHPAVVLIAGSGDNTRRFGTFVTFFVDLGMAVVAYDKRGCGASEGNWREGSYKVLAEDVARFVDALADRPDIDRKRIGLMGHSEGGYVAPITAAKREHVAFVLVRVGPAVPSPDVTQYALQHVGVSGGKSGTELAWSRFCKIVADSLRDNEPFETAQENLEPLRKEGLNLSLEAYRPSWEFRVRTANHNPADYLSTLRAPVLWFLGETDTNVETATTAAVLDKSLAEHPDATVVVLPNIDHTFIVRGGEGPTKYAPGFWDRIKEWLSSRSLTGGAAVR
jgi:hypothetical protein